MVGLTDHELFDKATADHFVANDRKALAMEDAYVFFEDVPDAFHDELTGLYNRFGYDFIISEMELSTTYLLMVDVDDFKTINEMFFLILNEVSRTLQTCY